MDPIISRVYEISVKGYDQSLKNMKALTSAFEKMDATKRKTDEQLRKAVEAGNQAQIDKLTLRLADLEKQLKSLDQQRQKSAKEVELLAKAEKLEAETRLTNTKNVIAQERELDRQISAEEKRTAAAQKSAEALKFEAGSYKDVVDQMRQLRPFIQGTSTNSATTFNLNGQALGITDAIAKYKELSAAEQDFRRQFTKDQSLVGEYRTGILSAFKDLGLEDVIKKQRNDINGQLRQLRTESEELAQQLKRTGQTGSEAFHKVETQLRENIALQEQLQKSLHNIDATFQNHGSATMQMSNAISSGFKNIRQQIGQVALGYIGLQTIFSQIGSSFNDSIKADSLETALKLVSKSEQELAVNQKFLAQTTELLGLEYVSTGTAFKNFYAASTLAGLSAEQTRKIFFAASGAAANLKLSQEDANGVLLAFSQIASKGKVQAEELRGQIGERIPGAFTIAAKAMGVSEQRLNKMLETGQVLSREFLPKFAEQLEKSFSVDTEKRATGLQASINRLKNEFTNLFRENQGGLSSFFSSIIGSATALVRLIPLLLAGLAVYSAAWVYNKTVLLGNIAATKLKSLVDLEALTITKLLTATEVEQAIVTKQVTGATAAWALAQKVLSGEMKIATAASVLFNNVWKASPGAIITTVLSGALILFSSFTNKTKENTKALDENSGAMKGNASSAKNLEEVHRNASNKIADQVTYIEKLTSTINDNTKSTKEKEKALKQLIALDPDFLSGLRLAKDGHLEGAQAVDKYVEALQKKALVEAAQEKSKSIFSDIINGQLQEAQILGQQKKLNDQRQKSIDDANKKTHFNLSPSDSKLLTAFTDKQLDGNAVQLDKVRSQIKGAKENLEQLKTLIKGLGPDALKVQFNQQASVDAGTKEKVAGASKLSAQQKDFLKDVDATRDELLAAEKLKRVQNTISEEEYLKNILKINQDAIDKKLAYLKGSNAEERRLVSELKLDRITQEQETNNKIFEQRKTALKNRLDDQIKDIQEADRRVQEDPVASASAKAESKRNADLAILALQKKFATEIDALEKQLGQQSLKNAKETADAIRKTKQELQKDEKAILDAEIEDIKRDGENAIANFKLTITNQRLAIADSNKPQRKKDIANKELDKQEAFGVLAREVATMELELPKYQEKLRLKQITDTDYTKFLEELTAKQAKLHNDQFKAAEKEVERYSNLGDLVKAKLSSLFGFDDGTEQGKENEKLLGQVIADSYSVAQQAMQNYFDAERAQVEQSKQLAYKRIDIEKEQLLAQAQSQNEKDAIEKQAQAKKEKADREAGEKLKKIKKAEARVALATELANIAVAAASNPLNGITLGAAGIAMYALLAGLAFARYASNVKAIDAQQFAGGGQAKPSFLTRIKNFFTGGRVQPVNLPSGKIAHVQNIPTQPNGDNVLATVRVGEVILNERQQSLLGGAAAMAKAKVPGFAGGGLVGSSFLGLNNLSLGDSLKAPIDPSSFLKPPQAGSDLSEVKVLLVQQTKNLDETARQIHQRIDKIRVVNDPRETLTVAGKIQAANKIGTV